MTYEEFKTHLLTFLWKQNDLDLVGSLDNLILMADSELDVVLKTQDTENTAVMYATTDTVQLPYDYDDMRDVAAPAIGELFYVKPSVLYSRRRRTTAGFQNIYSLQGNILLLAGDFKSSTDPLAGEDRLELLITYKRRIPNFKSAGTSWVCERYLSIYTYSVLAQCAPFLREDERVQLWLNRYQTLVETLRSEDAFHRERGTHADVPLPYPASATEPYAGSIYSRDR